MTDTATDTSVPPGKLREVVTYLEMLSRPQELDASEPPPHAGVRLERVANPAVPFYRFLYNTIGEPWLWQDRRRLSDDALAAQIQAAGVAIYVLYADGQPAGYVELDARVTGDVELVFCGLMPWAIGRGLGPWMLRRATVLAWDQLGARRFWVHTCSFDHPSALGMYKAAGFVPFAREVNIVPDPRADGLIPMNAAPHVPMTT